MIAYRVIQVIGIPLIFIPISTLNYVGIPREKFNQVSGISNFMRNIGGGIGVSLLNNLITRQGQIHRTGLTAHTNHANPFFERMLNGMTQNFISRGLDASQASHRALARLAAQVDLQSNVLGFVNSFWVMGVVVLFLIPLPFIMRKPSTDEAKASAAAIDTLDETLSRKLFAKSIGIYPGSDNFNSLGDGPRRHGHGFATRTFKCGSSRTLGYQHESVNQPHEQKTQKAPIHSILIQPFQSGTSTRTRHSLLLGEGHDLWRAGYSVDYICTKNNLEISLGMHQRNGLSKVIKQRIRKKLTSGFSSKYIETTCNNHHFASLRVLDARN
jgi:hypothetical protein